MSKKDLDDRYPLPTKDRIEAHIEENDEEPGKPIDPAFEEMIDILEEAKEKAEEASKLPPEKREEFWDREHQKLMCQWPKSPLGRCKDPEGVTNAILEAFGATYMMGYGDMQELCDFSVFKEALKRIDPNECAEKVGRGKDDELAYMLSRCLLATAEDITRERLIEDGHDEEQVQDTFVYVGESEHVFWDTFSYEWRGPLAEQAKKRFEEE
jgi:hypothetical protein